MILTRDQIKAEIDQANIQILTAYDLKIGTNSIDLHLDDRLQVYTSAILDLIKDNETQEMEIPDKGLILWPGEFYLGCTAEYTRTLKHIPMLEGISSNARLGLQIHMTAGFGDIGYCGKWTLEIRVAKPLKIYKGMRIAQIYYIVPRGLTEMYLGRYQDSNDIISSRSYKD